MNNKQWRYCSQARNGLLDAGACVAVEFMTACKPLELMAFIRLLPLPDKFGIWYFQEMLKHTTEQRGCPEMPKPSTISVSLGM
ncbi:MAG: hypothetical protein PHC50_06345 [Candidatus Cloacimonetes bacterium]|nr:hypothetical protein [Candidatus Cloacimonadota bacterium]